MTTNTSMPAESSYVHQGIQDLPLESSAVYEALKDIIASESKGIPVSSLESLVEQKLQRSLDYNSLGVKTLNKLLLEMCNYDLVTLSKHRESNGTYAPWAHWIAADRMPTESSYVHQEIQAKPTESPYVYKELRDIIASDTYGIFPVSCLETRYKEKFKRSLDYKSLSVKTIMELLFKMFDEGVVRLYKHEETNDRYVMLRHWVGDQRPKESSDVYQEIHDILEDYCVAIPMYSLSWLEESYERQFGRSLDYRSLEVENIEGLIRKMVDIGRVLLSEEDPETQISYVMCPSLGEYLLKDLYKNVQKLLAKHKGVIPLSSFEDEYNKEFKEKFEYHRYGLTGPDHLCELLKMGFDSSGEKVIKGCKIYNLRKRKITK